MTRQRLVFSHEFKHEDSYLLLKQDYSYRDPYRSLSVGDQPYVSGLVSFN